MNSSEVHHIPAGVVNLHGLLNPSKLALVVDIKGGVLDVMLLVDDVVPGLDGHQVFYM